METKLNEKVGEVISALTSAKHVDEVVCALHSLALLLFPLDSSLLSGQSPSSFPLLVNYVKRTKISKFTKFATNLDLEDCVLS